MLLTSIFTYVMNILNLTVKLFVELFKKDKDGGGVDE